MNSLKDKRSCQICRKKVVGDILIFEIREEGKLVSEQKMKFIYKEMAPVFLNRLFGGEGGGRFEASDDGDGDLRERMTPLILRFRQRDEI